MNFYNAVWILGKQRGERIADIARNTGVSRQCIDGYKKRNGISIEVAQRYADYFGITLDEFVRLAREQDEQN